MRRMAAAELGGVVLGFRVKEPWVPDAAWFPAEEASVRVVCSVSDCLSEPPPGWVDRWDFNRARCYDSEAAALATIPLGDGARYACFLYRLVPAVLDDDGRRVPVDPDEVFDDRLPPLPAPAAPPAGYVRLGYDVVSIGSTDGFECSPLSCNGMAGEIPVNRYCLLDDVERALGVARRFDEEQPEPGDYVVVEVSARAADIARVAPPS
jgi:hypothetical protein